MKTNNFTVSFKLNKKDRAEFTDQVVNYLDSENFRELYDYDYRCSKLVTSSRYLFEVFFYDLELPLSAMVFISTILSRASLYCIYPVELSHIMFNSLNKD